MPIIFHENRTAFLYFRLASERCADHFLSTCNVYNLSIWQRCIFDTCHPDIFELSLIMWFIMYVQSTEFGHRQWPWVLQWKQKLTRRYVWIKQDLNLVQKCVRKGDWFKSHFCWICLFDAVCRPDSSISDLILDRKVAPLWSIHISFYIPVCSGVYNTGATLGHIFTALRRLLDVKAQAVY